MRPRPFTELLAVGNNSEELLAMTKTLFGGGKACLGGSLDHLSGSGLSAQEGKMFSSCKSTGVNEICPNVLWCFPFLND